MGTLSAIPRRLLPDSMLVRVPDAFGGFSDAVEVSHVRFARKQSVVDDAHRSADGGAGKAYVDAVNSICAFEVPAGSRVEVGGHSYLVAECKRCEGFGGAVHHWELVLR